MGTGDLQSSNRKLAEYCGELKKRGLNRNILFVNCPQFNFEAFEHEVAKSKCYYAYPPRGLQCLASALEGRNLNIRILDLNYEFLRRATSDSSFNHADWLNILNESVSSNNPSIIGISNFYKIDAPHFFKISDFIRERDKNKVIIAGGANATYNAREFLDKNLCDFVCEREGENKIRFLIDNLYENTGTKPTPGILFKFDGKIERTDGDRDIVIPEGNLIDSYKLVDVEKYHEVGSVSPYSRMAGKDTSFSGMVINRGCAGQCRFCDVVDFMGKGVRSRNVEDILNEMSYLYDKRGVRYFELLDDDSARRRDTFVKVLEGIVEREMKISWASNNGIIARTLDEETMRKMRDSGCIGFKIGVESGNADILKKIKKPGTRQSFKEFSAIAQKFPEMFIVDNYILGLPDETFGQTLDSYLFSLDMNLDWSSYTKYQPNASLSDNTNTILRDREDFVPYKYAATSQLPFSGNILYGLDVFNIPKNEIPPREQLDEVWFTFNFARNFVLNKNLSTSNTPDKFVKWLNAISERYPTHPYINFSLALAHALRGEKEQSEIQVRNMNNNLEDNYWRTKFDHLRLTPIASSFPIDSKHAGEALNILRKQYER